MSQQLVSRISKFIFNQALRPVFTIIVKIFSEWPRYSSLLLQSALATEPRDRLVHLQPLRCWNSGRFGFAVAVLLCTSPVVMAVGQTTQVNVASDGTPGNGSTATSSAISSDGRFVAFNSWSDNLVPGDTNLVPDIFVRDLLSGKTTRVNISSRGDQAYRGAESPAISADGRYVVFSSASNLVPGDNDWYADIFIHDRKNALTSNISVAWNGALSNGNSFGPRISANGRYVSFYSIADNLVPGDTNGTTDCFVHDRKVKQTTRISISSSGEQGNDLSNLCEISSDGRYVAFSSEASNLVSGDTNGTSDVFIHDRVYGKTKRVSLSSTGAQGNSYSFLPALSADGRFVVFSSGASNLVSGYENGWYDTFVYDSKFDMVSLISASSNGTQGNAESFGKGISADGRFVLFYSDADNLVSNDTNGEGDVFVKDRLSGRTTRVSLAYNNTQAFGHNFPGAISADGRQVVFSSLADYLVPGEDFGWGDFDEFVRDRLLLPNKKADLSVTQSESGDPIAKGNHLIYTIKVKNNGVDMASDVNLTDLVPQNAQLLSVTPSQGSCYKAPITVCRLGNLASGAKATVWVKLKAIRSGRIRNTASVNAAPKDLAPLNNSSTISTRVEG